MTNTVLCSGMGTGCFMFLDDIVICANSLTEHDAKLKTVFERLRIANESFEKVTKR
jgi:hypothetical protein